MPPLQSHSYCLFYDSTLTNKFSVCSIKLCTEMTTTQRENVKNIPAFTLTPLLATDVNILRYLAFIIPFSQCCINLSDAHRICPAIKIWLNVSNAHRIAQNGNTVSARKSTSQSRILPKRRIEQIDISRMGKVARYGLQATLRRFMIR